MKVINGIGSISRTATPTVLTIGNFDGLHLGHRELMSQVIESARKMGALATVVSFDPHPTRVLRPESPSPRLFSTSDLIEQLDAMGIDQFVIEPFTKELALLSAEDFVEYLSDHLLLAKLIIGHDFHFGHNREGTSDKLRDWAQRFGFAVEEVAPFKLQGEVVSSSQIRRLITAGEVALAAQRLERPYYVEGEIVRGDGRGQKIGFATANLACRSEVVPATGVYVTQFVVQGKAMKAVTNVGFKPTFQVHGPLSIETHVLDHEENFFGASVRLEFLKRLRAEMKFSGPEALVQQIKSDVAAARKYFVEKE